MKADCESILLRQFDADCRDAANLPVDVRAHLANCHACQQEWALAQNVDLNIRKQIKLQPSNQMYRRAYCAALETPTAAKTFWQHVRDVSMSLASAIAGVAIIHVMIGFNSINWISVTLFLLFASSVYLMSLFRKLNDDLTE